MNKRKLLADIGEDDFIKLIDKFCRVDSSVVKGIGDDTAILKFDKENYLLVTTDMLIENIHFKKSLSPKHIGRKALACNISDIAAMGGIPKYAVISVGLPKRTNVKFAEEILKGIVALARQFNISIVGGDTNHSNKIIINICLFGLVEKKNVVLRSTAKPGDSIFVTGSLGGSLKSGKHFSFVPKIKEARWLVENSKPSSMIDISDGLILDLSRIVNSSNAGALISESLIPKKNGCSLKNAFFDGEDFELLFTLPKSREKKLNSKLKNKKTSFSIKKIGLITKKIQGIKLVQKNGIEKEITPKGYLHF